MALTTPATIGPRAAERSVRDQLTRGGTDWAGSVFLVLLLAVAGLQHPGAGHPASLDVLQTGMPVLIERFGDFITGTLRTQADEAGLYQGLVGSFWICVFVVALAFPLGIAAAIYLEEYAGDSRFSRFVNVNIRNLAGVPSIVYGILGLTIFMKALGGSPAGQRQRSHDRVGRAHPGDPGAADRDHHRGGGGAGRAQRAARGRLRRRGHPLGGDPQPTCCPYAAPGIITGTVLSLARALGEAAPLILVGADDGPAGQRSVAARRRPAPRAVHRPAHRRHRVDQEPAGGVRRDRRRGHHRDAGHRDHRQHRRRSCCATTTRRRGPDRCPPHRPHGARHSGRERRRHPRGRAPGRPAAPPPRSSSTSPDLSVYYGDLPRRPRRQRRRSTSTRSPPSSARPAAARPPCCAASTA